MILKRNWNAALNYAKWTLNLVYINHILHHDRRWIFVYTVPCEVEQHHLFNLATFSNKKPDIKNKLVKDFHFVYCNSIISLNRLSNVYSVTGAYPSVMGWRQGNPPTHTHPPIYRLFTFSSSLVLQKLYYGGNQST